MRIIVVGLGIQGQKRRAVAGEEVIATVDPFHIDAQYKYVQDVPLDIYDAALLCIPDDPKIAIVEFLLKNSKHVLVEKPLFAANPKDLCRIKSLSEENHTACYTAYNHRFEPHFVRMRNLLQSEKLGRIYSVKIFYGNGTARLVRDSAWRDKGDSVLSDLGSHLLDTLNFWFDTKFTGFRINSANCFENVAYDHVSFGLNSGILIQLEATLLSWRNQFYCDVLAENGSAHISSLCKWGPSSFILRDRKLPSGKPDEDCAILTQPDPTWKIEYEYFKEFCKRGANNIDNDIWINDTLAGLSASLKKEKVG